MQKEMNKAEKKAAVLTGKLNYTQENIDTLCSFLNSIEKPYDQYGHLHVFIQSVVLHVKVFVTERKL